MFDVSTAVILISSLIGLVVIGVHIAVALGMTSALGIWLVTGQDANAFKTVQVMLAAKAYEGIRDYVFAVIPLFMLMGEFIGKSGAITDVYKGINSMLSKLPGRLAIATVFGNALFSLIICAILDVKTLVFPDPAPATISRGPSRCNTASF